MLAEMATLPGGGKRGGEMKVLIACEESQTVCKASRARGHMVEQWGGDVMEEA